MADSPKILLYDLENSPSLGWYYELYKEGNIVGTEQPWFMLSFAYKWLGEKHVTCHALPDYKGYKSHKEDDEALVKELHAVMSKADIIVAHNGDRFDIRKANARFIAHGLDPLKPLKTVDTLKLARKHFYFDSNKLDSLGQYLGVGRKLPHTGFELWRRCISGDMAAWGLMKRYNAQDVRLLEKVYLKLRPWGAHPNLGHLTRKLNACPKCQSTHLEKRGFSYKKGHEAQRYQCVSCGAWSQGPWEKLSSKIEIS